MKKQHLFYIQYFFDHFRSPDGIPCNDIIACFFISGHQMASLVNQPETEIARVTRTSQTNSQNLIETRSKNCVNSNNNNNKVTWAVTTWSTKVTQMRSWLCDAMSFKEKWRQKASVRLLPKERRKNKPNVWYTLAAHFLNAKINFCVLVLTCIKKFVVCKHVNPCSKFVCIPKRREQPLLLFVYFGHNFNGHVFSG